VLNSEASAAMTLVYFVQHGQKEPGPGDPGLTEVGRQQAAATGRFLSGCRLRAIYSSPARRARETAEPIAAAAGLTVQFDGRLRERMNWDGVQPFDAFLADWDRSDRDRDLALGGAESSRSAGQRLEGFLASLATAQGPVAAVTHGGVTTDLLRNLLGDAALPPSLLASGVPPGAITTLDGSRVIAIASVTHLRSSFA
jgi:broad specificity phosphatase PhoE